MELNSTNETDMGSHRKFMIVFRIVCYICAAYFLAMGFALMLFPAFITRITGPQDPIILGMLRGSGGSIIPYSILYLIVAMAPFSRRWAIIVIALANIVAIILDFLSVFLGEYLISYAMFDVPIELLSLLMMVLALVKFSYYNQGVVIEND